MPSRTSLFFCLSVSGLLACEPHIEVQTAADEPVVVADVASLVRLKADDVVSSERIRTLASLQFDLAETTIKGRMKYEEQSASGDVICSVDTMLQGVADADAGGARHHNASWAYRFGASEADASACQVPSRWLSFVRGADGPDGVVFRSETSLGSLDDGAPAIVMGAQQEGKSSVLAEHSENNIGALGLQTLEQTDDSLHLTINKKSHASTLYDHALESLSCRPEPSTKTQSVVQVDVPLTGRVSCSKDGFHADIWTVQLEAGQSVAASVLSDDVAGPFHVYVLGPSGCRYRPNGWADGCPEDQHCPTLQQKADLAGEYAVVVEKGVRCDEAESDYELHIEVH